MAGIVDERGGLDVVVSHPFVKEPTNGWGTRLLWKSEPFTAGI